MAKIGFPFVSTTLGYRTNETEAVADAIELTLCTVGYLDRLAKPKRFNLQSVNLRDFRQVIVTERNHAVRVVPAHDEPPLTPIDEIATVQIYGDIGGKIVNVIARHIFHTYKENRSGSGETLINGKENIKPEFGGLTLNDIWQDSGEWQKFGRQIGVLPKEVLIEKA